MIMPAIVFLLIGLTLLGQTGPATEPLFQTHSQIVEDKVELDVSPEKLVVDDQAEEEIFKLTNDERIKAGLPPLVWDEEMAEVARGHSFDMWQREYFAHENPDGEKPLDRLQKAKIKFKFAGENLALARSVKRAHTGLMNSPGHRKNILDPSFRRVGIGVIDGGSYGKMFTQNFAD